MNAPLPTPTPAEGRFMSGAEYRESLRRYRPVVYVDGQRIDSVRRRAAAAARHQCAGGQLRLRARRRQGAADDCGAELRAAGA